MKVALLIVSLLSLAGALHAQILSSRYGLSAVPAYLDQYIDLQNAIAARDAEWLVDRTERLGGHDNRGAGGTSGVSSNKTPEQAYRALLDSLRNAVSMGLPDPFNPLPTTSKAQLEVAEKWLCPVIGQGFMAYIDDTMGVDVLFGDLSRSKLSTQQLDDILLRAAERFFARARIELRIQSTRATESLDQHFERLFIKCIVTPLQSDLK